MQKYLILLGDIGGTNARLKIIDLRSNTIVAEKNYLSHSFPSLESVIT
jgi:glucokinase